MSRPIGPSRRRADFLPSRAGVGYSRSMLAGAPTTVAPSSFPRARVAAGPVCPHCDAPSGLGATLCDYCGATLGEPPRRSGMTQRALALDAESARLALEAAAPSSAPTVTPSTTPVRARRALTLLERVFVVLTLGLGWLWLRRRLA